MNVIIPIDLSLVYVALGLRLMGLLGMIVVIFKMIEEIKANNKIKTTKILLLIFGVAFLFGSFIPVQQNICYLRGCLNLATVMPLGVITAALNLISVLIFLILYYTKDQDL